jgi:hypothetical protein
MFLATTVFGRRMYVYEVREYFSDGTALVDMGSNFVVVKKVSELEITSERF